MRIVACVLAVFGLLSAALASEVVPQSYTSPPGDQGWLVQYLDASGRELTDGVHSGPWPAESGYPGVYNYDYGPWYGWDGRWHQGPLEITFTFQQQVSLSGVEIWTGRDTAGAIYIPGSVEILTRGPSGWVQMASQSYDDLSFADGYRHTLAIPVSAATTDEVRLVMTPTDDRWIILDEVDFTGTIAPEPSSILVLIFGLGGTGALVKRKRP